MSVRYFFVLCCMLLVAACSDNPVAPETSASVPAAFPKVVQSPTSFLTGSGPRVEVYANGILKEVLTGKPGAQLPASLIDVPADFGKTLDALERNPINKRSAHFARLLKTIANAPAASHGKAVDAVSRQLLKETQHRDTTLADGTCVLEYYFDGQLATRVVLPHTGTASGKRFREINDGPVNRVAAETTPDDGTSCISDCTATNDPALDAMYWASVTWMIDQVEEMESIAQSEGGDDGSGTYPVYAKLCLSQSLNWAYSVGSFGLAGYNTVNNWDNSTTSGKLNFYNTIYQNFSRVVQAWITLHDCWHP